MVQHTLLATTMSPWPQTITNLSFQKPLLPLRLHSSSLQSLQGRQSPPDLLSIHEKPQLEEGCSHQRTPRKSLHLKHLSYELQTIIPDLLAYLLMSQKDKMTRKNHPGAPQPLYAIVGTMEEGDPNALDILT